MLSKFSEKLSMVLSRTYTKRGYDCRLEFRVVRHYLKSQHSELCIRLNERLPISHKQAGSPGHQETISFLFTADGKYPHSHTQCSTNVSKKH